MEEGFSIAEGREGPEEPLSGGRMDWPPPGADPTGVGPSMPTPGVPFLPVARAVPSERSTPALSVADRIAFVPVQRSPTRRQGHRGRNVAGLMLLFVVVGSTAAVVHARGGSDHSDRVQPANSSRTTATSVLGAGTTGQSSGVTETTLATGLPPSASAQPSPDPTVAPTVPPAPVEVTVSVPVTEDPAALRDRCRLEWGKVFAALQDFVYATGAHPESPDALVAIGRLEPNPVGWNTRWTFKYTPEGIYVVAVPDTECDINLN